MFASGGIGLNAFLRLLGRSVTVILACACALLIAVQYWHAFGRTAALGRELAAAKRDILDFAFTYARGS